MIFNAGDPGQKKSWTTFGEPYYVDTEYQKPQKDHREPHSSPWPSREVAILKDLYILELA